MQMFPHKTMGNPLGSCEPICISDVVPYLGLQVEALYLLGGRFPICTVELPVQFLNPMKFVLEGLSGVQEVGFEVPLLFFYVCLDDFLLGLESLLDHVDYLLLSLE